MPCFPDILVLEGVLPGFAAPTCTASHTNKGVARLPDQAAPPQTLRSDQRKQYRRDLPAEPNELVRRSARTIPAERPFPLGRVARQADRRSAPGKRHFERRSPMVPCWHSG